LPREAAAVSQAAKARPASLVAGSAPPRETIVVYKATKALPANLGATAGGLALVRCWFGGCLIDCLVV